MGFGKGTDDGRLRISNAIRYAMFHDRWPIDPEKLSFHERGPHSVGSLASSRHGTPRIKWDCRRQSHDTLHISRVHVGVSIGLLAQLEEIQQTQANWLGGLLPDSDRQYITLSEPLLKLLSCLRKTSVAGATQEPDGMKALVYVLRLPGQKALGTGNTPV